MTNKALVIGSIAYDRIFSIDGNVKDKILLRDGKIEKIDMTFRAEEPQIHYGGTAGNVAYGLGLLKQKAIMISIVGDEFKNDYKKHLEDLGIVTREFEKKDSLTATFYGINDASYQTISIWQPNAAEYIEEVILETQLNELEKKDISITIISASGKPFALPKFILEIRNSLGNGVKIICDPGQDLSYLKKQELIDSLENSNILMVNDVELNQIYNMHNISKEEIFKLGIEVIIETLGEDGSRIHYPEKEVNIPIAKPRLLKQVTGAGDAFRSGFIYGLLNDKDFEESCRYGAVMGSFAVEELGGQGYRISIEDFQKRYEETFTS